MDIPLTTAMQVKPICSLRDGSQAAAEKLARKLKVAGDQRLPLLQALRLFSSVHICFDLGLKVMIIISVRLEYTCCILFE